MSASDRILSQLPPNLPCPSPLLDITSPKRPTVDFSYPRHKVVLVVDASASLFQTNRGDLGLMERVEEVVVRLWEVRDETQEMVVSVVFAGCGEGDVVAVHSYPLLSQLHLEEVLSLTHSAFVQVLQTPPSTSSLLHLLTTARFSLSLMPSALPCIILISDFTSDSLTFTHYGDVLMDLQSQDLRLILYPVTTHTHWGYIHTDLKTITAGFDTIFISHPKDIDEKTILRHFKVKNARNVEHFATMKVTSYQSHCEFPTFLRCRVSEGFNLTSYCDETATFTRKFTPSLDLEVTCTVTPPLCITLSLTGCTHRLKRVLKTSITAFIRKMKQAEAILSIMQRREPPPASFSLFPHILPFRTISLLLFPDFSWENLYFSFKNWSSRSFSDYIYLKETNSAVTWVKIDRKVDNVVEIVVMDWKGEGDLKGIKEEIKGIGCWLYEGQITSVLIEGLNTSSVDGNSPAASFLQYTACDLQFSSEKTVHDMAEILGESREKEGYLRLETLESGKRLYVSLENGVLYQSLLVLTPAWLRSCLYTPPHTSAPELLSQDLALYTHFSHFRYLQCLCLTQLTNQDGGPKRFIDEKLSICAVFKMLMRTLGEDGQGVLVMVSEEDYLKCFPEMHKVDLYREMYRRYKEVEDAGNPVESMSSFLSALPPVSKPLWQPGTSDLHPLITATYQSVSDHCFSESGYTYFLRHISSWALLIWRIDEAMEENLQVEVFSYQLKEQGRGRGDLEIAWTLTEKALAAALTHYVFDELFHSKVSLSDLTHTLTLCIDYPVTVSLALLHAAVERLGGGVEECEREMERQWEELWGKYLELHEEQTVFYSKHPNQLLFLQLSPPQPRLSPVFLGPSLQLHFYSHSSHGFATSSFRRSIQFLIDEISQGVETIANEFTLEVLRLTGLMDVTTLSMLSTLMSTLSVTISDQIDLKSVGNVQLQDTQWVLRSNSILKLTEVDTTFILLDIQGFVHGSEYFDRAKPPFWMLFTLSSPDLIQVKAVIPASKMRQGYTSSLFLEDFSHLKPHFIHKITQCVLLRTVRETGVCSHLLYPNSTLSLPVLHRFQLDLNRYLSIETTLSSLWILFDTEEYRIRPNKHLFRLILPENRCVLFTISAKSNSNLSLDVYSLEENLAISMVSTVFLTARRHLQGISTQLLAEHLMYSPVLAETDLDIISLTPRLFPVSSSINLTQIRLFLVSILQLSLREVDKTEGNKGFLYNSKLKMDNCEFGNGLMWVEIGNYIEIRESSGIKSTEIDIFLENAVKSAQNDYKIENFELKSPFESYFKLENMLFSPVFSYPHYISPIADLDEFGVILEEIVREIMGKNTVFASFRGEESTGFERKQLLVCTGNNSTALVYKSSAELSRTWRCLFYVTEREWRGVCYNLAANCREKIAEKVEMEIRKNRGKWEVRGKERMGKLGLIDRPFIELTPASPVACVSPGVFPSSLSSFSLTSLSSPSSPSSPISLKPRYLQRLQHYQDLLPVFDSWSHRHHLTTSSDSLSLLENHSFFLGIWTTSSPLLRHLRDNAQGWEVAERLLEKVTGGVKDRLAGFEEMKVGKNTGKSTAKLKRSGTEKAIFRSVGRSPIYLKRILNDSLLLVTISLSLPSLSFRLSCVPSLLSLLSPLDTPKAFDFLHKEIYKCKKEIKNKGILFDAETVLISELLHETPKKGIKNLYKVGKELVSEGVSYMGIEGNFSLDTGPECPSSLPTIFTYIASKSSEFYLFPYMESNFVLFQTRTAGNEVILPENAGKMQAGLVIMYRECMFRSRKVMGLTSMPSANVINLEYLVLMRKQDSAPVHKAVRALMADSIKRAIRGVKRELDWQKATSQDSISIDAINSLISNSYQIDLPEKYFLQLVQLQEVFSLDLIEYLRSAHPGNSHFVEEKANWHLLVVVSEAEIVYLRVSKSEGSLHISPLVRKLPAAKKTFFASVLDQVFHWLYLQLTC